MLDLFEEKEQPGLYIADIIIKVQIPTRSKKVRKYDTTFIKLYKHPVVLLDGKFPTDNVKSHFIRTVYDRHINKGDFSKIIFNIQSIENIKFSSKLAYYFDYSKH